MLGWGQGPSGQSQSYSVEGDVEVLHGAPAWDDHLLALADEHHLVLLVRGGLSGRGRVAFVSKGYPEIPEGRVFCRRGDVAVLRSAS